MKPTIRWVEFPIQIFSRQQAAVLNELNVEPEFEPSVVSIDLHEISSIHKSPKGAVITLKNGLEWFITMSYDEVLETYINIMREDCEINFFHYNKKEIVKSLN